MSEMSDADILATARKRFRLCCDAESRQREREREDLMFQVPELQWDEAAKRERMGDGLTPPRPTLSISLVDQPIQLVTNQMRNANLGVNIHPISEDADDDTAEMLQGLYRHIERTSRAELARGWAFDRAVWAGRGFYRVLTEYDHEGGKKGDLKIVIKRIREQEGVYFDPSAQEPDYCDARYAFVVAWILKDEFKKEWSNSETDADNWESTDQYTPEWAREDAVLVAEYWEREEKDDDEGGAVVTVRKITGGEILETEEWMGRYIPLIPVLGRELVSFDGERRYFGMIRPARDGQRLVNYSASTLVESMALEPKTPFIGVEGQFEGYEQQWKQANTRNQPYLEYKNVSLNGTPAPPPQRAQIDQARSSLALMGFETGKSFVQSTTAVYDPSLGRESQRDKSGKAIMALQQQAEAGTGHFLQNLADISMTHEAKIVLDLIPKVYDRPGRVARIIRGDDAKSEPVMVNAPFVINPKTGRPMPAQSSTQPNAKHYDLSKGIYTTSVSVGKSFQTRLEAGSTMVGELLTAHPELFPALGDIFLRFQDWPGAKEMADRMVKIREKTMPGIGESKDGTPPPEQLQAQIAAMQQQMQMQNMQMQAMAKAIETDQAKQAAQLQIAQMNNESKERIAASNNETKLAIEGLISRMETALAGINNANERDIEARRMAHEVAMGAASGRTMEFSRDQGQETGEEMGQETSNGSSSMPMEAPAE